MTELHDMTIDEVDTANRWLDAFTAAKKRADKAAAEAAKNGGG